MEDVLDKLKLLRYQQQFCTEASGFRPINSRFYFTNPAQNPNEQFYYFTSLATWLLHKIGVKSFEQPGQFDDPNASAANIANELKKLGVPFEYGPHKLKQGHGEGVIYALQILVDKALAVSGFQFQKPVHKVDDYPEEAEVDADAEITIDAIEERLAASDSDSEDLYMAASTSTGAAGGAASGAAGTSSLSASNANPIDASSAPGAGSVPPPRIAPPTQIRPSMDAAEWRLELERVTPMLRVVVVPNDNKDWRCHLESLRHHHKSIATTGLGATTAQLTRLRGEIEKTLEKISSRERYVNGQFEGMVEEQRGLQDQVGELRQRFNVSNSNVGELSNELTRISEDLDAVKSKMDDIGNGMTDSKPLVNIKQGVGRLKTDIKQMDLRIGVIEHTLLQAKEPSGAALPVPIFSPLQTILSPPTPATMSPLSSLWRTISPSKRRPPSITPGADVDDPNDGHKPLPQSLVALTSVAWVFCHTRADLAGLADRFARPAAFEAFEGGAGSDDGSAGGADDASGVRLTVTANGNLIMSKPGEPGSCVDSGVALSVMTDGSLLIFKPPKQPLLGVCVPIRSMREVEWIDLGGGPGDFGWVCLGPLLPVANRLYVMTRWAARKVEAAMRHAFEPFVVGQSPVLGAGQIATEAREQRNVVVFREDGTSDIITPSPSTIPTTILALPFVEPFKYHPHDPQNPHLARHWSALTPCSLLLRTDTLSTWIELNLVGTHRNILRARVDVRTVHSVMPGDSEGKGGAYLQLQVPTEKEIRMYRVRMGEGELESVDGVLQCVRRDDLRKRVESARGVMRVERLNVPADCTPLFTHSFSSATVLNYNRRIDLGPIIISCVAHPSSPGDGTVSIRSAIQWDILYGFFAVSSISYINVEGPGVTGGKVVTIWTAGGTSYRLGGLEAGEVQRGLTELMKVLAVKMARQREEAERAEMAKAAKRAAREAGVRHNKEGMRSLTAKDDSGHGDDLKMIAVPISHTEIRELVQGVELVQAAEAKGLVGGADVPVEQVKEGFANLAVEEDEVSNDDDLRIPASMPVPNTEIGELVDELKWVQVAENDGEVGDAVADAHQVDEDIGVPILDGDGGTNDLNSLMVPVPHTDNGELLYELKWVQGAEAEVLTGRAEGQEAADTIMADNNNYLSAESVRHNEIGEPIEEYRQVYAPEEEEVWDSVADGDDPLLKSGSELGGEDLGKGGFCGDDFGEGVLDEDLVDEAGLGFLSTKVREIDATVAEVEQRLRELQALSDEDSRDLSSPEFQRVELAAGGGPVTAVGEEMGGEKLAGDIAVAIETKSVVTRMTVKVSDVRDNMWHEDNY
ncbi:Intraflagellar transport protein 57 [Irineochytrium annulatum]|nr:Intraflagellar transport protein 57 [Irineochytrium annulatum]